MEHHEECKGGKEETKGAGGDESKSNSKKGVVVNVGATGGAGAESLQARFLRFKQQRAKALKMSKQAAAKKRADPLFRAKLRQKFIDTAHKYIGVPYAQKYHEPGSELYNAPLFLDCCGLVRQVMDDLQDEFGFRIGRWNQAYMFDTLPKKLSFEDLKPGDLVFYSGIYYRKNAKQQKHNMVHVEIFLGGETGEGTIGSRWQKGRIKLFDSYKFTSKNYHSIEYHFRSLDTWLDGVCKSHCDEHPWELKGFQNVDSAKSVFAESADAQTDDEAQDPDEFTATPAVVSDAACRSRDEAPSGGDDAQGQAAATQ